MTISPHPSDSQSDPTPSVEKAQTRCTCAESNSTGATSPGYRCAACVDDSSEHPQCKHPNHGNVDHDCEPFSAPPCDSFWHGTRGHECGPQAVDE